MAEMIFMVATGIVLLSLVISTIRFLAGPDTVNRVVAFDVITIISISLIALIAHYALKAIYLDVAVVYGLLSFLGVLVVARYLERGM